MANKGWLNRQIQKAADTVQSLPEWMRNLRFGHVCSSSIACQKEESSSHCATTDGDMTIEINEEERQLILLALALMALARPGFEHLAADIARKLSGWEMFNSFKAANKT